MECPRCETDIGHDVNYCRSCGLPVGTLRDVVRDWNCPRCEVELDGQPSACPECGLKIEKLRERVLPPHPESSTTAGRQGETGQTQHESSQQPSEPATQQPTVGAPASGSAGDTSKQATEQPQGGQPTQQSGTRDPQSGTPETRPGTSGRRAAWTQGNRQAQQSLAAARTSLERVPVVPAVLAGVAAYALNFALFFVLLIVEFPDRGESAYYGVTEFAGWFLYNAHQVEIAETTSSTRGMTSQTSNYLVEAYSSTSTTVPDFLYYLVPMVVLYLAGLAVVRRARPTPERWQDGAAVGVPLAGGYAAATLLGALSVFSVDVTNNYGGGSLSIQPELLPALLLMGIAYPVIIGGIAGAIGSREPLF